MIGEAIAMEICTSASALEIWLRDQPSSFSIDVVTRLSEDRAENEIASTRKQKPTMIQAPRSCCCRVEVMDVMDCLCQGWAGAIILGDAGCRSCGERRGWHALDAALSAEWPMAARVK